MTNHLLSASAGSGKTHALTTQYLRLLRAQHREIESGNATALRPESLLAVTFTRKAAGEIFDRILARLADAALSDAGLLELREAFGEEALTQETCRDLLHHFCRSLHRVQVGTLDSFFGRLCQVYRQEAGLGGDLRMTDLKSPHCTALQKEALLSLLKSSDLEETDRLFQTLTKQKAASSVFSKLLPLLQAITEAVDGAGPHCWEQLVVPDRPAQAAIDAALKNLDDYRQTLTGKQWPPAVAGDLERFRDCQWEEFLGKGLAKPCLGDCTYYGKTIPEERVQDYLVLLAVVKQELLGELKERTLALREISAAFAKHFTAERRKHGFLLFSETPALLGRVLDDPAQTGRRLDGPLEHLLLDEFQDTSDAQWGLLRGFARQAALGPGSVFVVGDAKQAIYGWRGGRAEIFEQFGSDIQPLTEGTLEKSYRSSAVVLGVVNSVFGAIHANEALKDHTQTAERWASYFHDHQTARPQPGFVELCVSPVPEDPIAASADGNGEAGNVDDEEDGGAGWGAAGASPHLAQCGKRIAQEIGRLPPEKSVGVLVRTNKTLAQMVDLLRAEGVAVSGEGVGKIADDPAVELILSALLLADHPGHTAAAYHLACSPLGPLLRLPPAGAEANAAASETASAAAAIRRRVLSDGYAGIIVEWAAALAPYGLDRTARRLEQLLELAAGLDALPPLRPSEFVRAVRESTVENPGAARVRVMTVNRAKGLEFDAVFLPDLEWKTRASDAVCLVKRASIGDISLGASPIEAVYARPSKAVQQIDPALSALAEAEAAEEVTGMLCLLYVAMTRPRSALHLYVAPHKLNKNGSPEKPGLKPAALLRAAFCGSASHPAQGSDWKTLGCWGEPAWWPDTPPVERPAAEPPPRPALRFKPSDGIRRGFLPSEKPERDNPKAAEDLLRLQGGAAGRF